jgi:HPt (histidine-containing phosphotransfer) domain-containing protein
VDKAIFDWEDALRRTESDAELLGELVGMFLDSADEFMGTIQTAVRDGDSEALYGSAHSLKGTLGTLGAHRACAAALTLEQMGRNHDLTEVHAAHRVLEQRITELDQALRTWRRNLPIQT